MHILYKNIFICIYIYYLHTPVPQVGLAVLRDRNEKTLSFGRSKNIQTAPGAQPAMY